MSERTQVIQQPREHYFIIDTPEESAEGTVLCTPREANELAIELLAQMVRLGYTEDEVNVQVDANEVEYDWVAGEGGTTIEQLAQSIIQANGFEPDIYDENGDPYPPGYRPIPLFDGLDA